MGLTLIKAATASGSPAVISFVDGTSDVVFDNTYNEYQFYFVNILAATNGTHFEFQVNSTNDPGGDYDTSLITSTYFRGQNHEGGGGGGLGYSGSNDLAQSADEQRLAYETENDADEGISGVLTVYDPSSTTYVKHFTSTGNYVHDSGKYCNSFHVAGYINDYQYAIDEIRFKMDSGNIDAGTIYMYGVS